MSGYSTKAFFKKKLSEYLEDGDDYFEVSPAPDCCSICREKANKKIAIISATESDYPPFHKECRCNTLSLGEGQKAGTLNVAQDRYATGEYPMKRCVHCKEWTEGNSVFCSKCGAPQ